MKTSKKSILSIFFSLIAVTCFSQKIDSEIRYNVISPGTNIICYTTNTRLEIEDFKGEPVENTPAIAITSSGVSFKAAFKSIGSKATLLNTVSCNFDKNLSWMKERGKNEYVLGHEQHHFDITYLSTLAFIKKLKQARFTVDNYQEKLQSIYTTTMQQMEKLQHQYDGETMHGQSKEQQTAWNRKIDEQLQEVTVK